MNFFSNRFYFLFLAFGLILVSPACVDLEFDEPPVTGEDPDIQANATIAELKALLVSGQLVEIVDDLVVDGIVVADDRSGNYFRSFIFQDETGGIEILINLTDAYNYYPIGRRLFIKCKGLWLGNDNGIIQLGGYKYREGGADLLGDIINLNRHILRGSFVGAPEPKVVTINSLGAGDVSTLVKLENVEFASVELGQTYADPVGRRTLNRTVQDCDGNTIVVRSSGFAEFAGETVAEGNGSLTAIYSVFGTTKQLFIRELTDVQMQATRCSGSGGNAELMTIAEVRAHFNSGAGTAPEERKIRGIVISDKDNGNFVGQNMVLQDATGGIVVRFQGNHNFSLGQEVEVVISGQELSEFNGLLQLNFLANELATSLGAGTLPTPRVVTVSQALANAEAWESTLVRIEGATISGGATYSGGRTVSDATGSIDLFTRSQATFSGNPVPAGSVNIVAIVSQFNSPQLVIRNLDDVETEGGGGDPQYLSLAEVRNLFEGGSGSVPAAKKVRGVVISDKDNFNWTGRNMVLQDTSGGIVVRFTADHSFALGEELDINVGGMELSEFNGLLQINNVPNANASSFGPGTLPAPRVATIQEILDNLEGWESTLVKVQNASFTAGGTFSGTNTLTDGTGSIAIFTRTQATFADAALPAGSFALTGVVTQFNDPQVTIRNLNDIED